MHIAAVYAKADDVPGKLVHDHEYPVALQKNGFAAEQVSTPKAVFCVTEEGQPGWTLRGLVTYYVLFVMRLETRSVHIVGVTTAPNRAFMQQMARNLTDVDDGFLLNSRYLIMDRDTKYTDAFRGHLDREGVKPVRCPARAPNCNAFAERFVRSVKDECLDRMILFGEASLRRVLREYDLHYHAERNHQGVGNRLLNPVDRDSSTNDPIHCRERLGGLLNFYYRQAA